MEYTVEFGVDVISKRNLISRKNGEIDVTTEATIEELNWEDNKKVLMDMIFLDVQPKLKQKIFNVEILKIREK
jgi:hypothetical protein